jgi:predicted nuclease of restriction endonuclease-like (RecB) superfamily
MLFERTMLSNKRNKALIEKNKSLGILRDNYTLEFLNLPEEHKERDLQKSTIPRRRASPAQAGSWVWLFS